MSQLEKIEEAYALITSYTMESGRFGLRDLITFDALMWLYERDMDVIQPEHLWLKTPDELMEIIANGTIVFTPDFGWDDLYDSLMDWADAEGYRVHQEELDDDEYEKLLEGTK